MLQKKRIGVNIFFRGMKGGIRSIKTPVYNITLYELLKTYSVFKMQKAFKIINIPRLPVFSAEEGIKQIKENFESIKDWKEIETLIPQKFKQNKKLSRTGLAGIFAASLELTKQGTISMLQKKIFDKLLIKKIN
jgi:Uncharacterized conserved protein